MTQPAGSIGGLNLESEQGSCHEQSTALHHAVKDLKSKLEDDDVGVATVQEIKPRSKVLRVLEKVHMAETLDKKEPLVKTHPQRKRKKQSKKTTGRGPYEKPDWDKSLIDFSQEKVLDAVHYEPEQTTDGFSELSQADMVNIVTSCLKELKEQLQILQLVMDDDTSKLKQFLFTVSPTVKRVETILELGGKLQQKAFDFIVKDLSELTSEAITVRTVKMRGASKEKK
ncbi:PREDICTED: uncharacterized protein LOC104728331 [Camelina sativa]|uniref:Uncharacterized protein LOC104728331 n=1 Tax=Camelina sativa TaxID=90675 RepID=A0ABM0USM6_CAMSA|nr:PREDICTED: uncharacterized protein LOC104728331 [Camelina sativa]